MPRLRIVTDSTAHLDPAVVAQHQITVLPVEIRLGDDRFLIGSEDSTTPLFQKMMAGPTDAIEALIPRRVIYETYDRLSRETDQILVILSSGKLSGALRAAHTEARSFLGRCSIEVTDSLTTSWGLGLVVTAAAQAAEENPSLDAIVRLVRGMLPHIYVVFFVERLDYLEQGGRIGPAQALLGTMLRIKPLLLIEEGEIIPMEKVRTRGMAIEKLADFVAEFATLEKVAILCSPLGNGIEDLRVELDERLGGSLPDLDYPIIEYDPVLACHMGPEALGVAVIEGH